MKKTPLDVAMLSIRSAAVGLSALFCVHACRADESPQDIADKLQVFWDDQIIDQSGTTASRVPHRPEFAGKVLDLDKPWEGNWGCYASVVKVGDTWRMYRQVASSPDCAPFFTGLRIGLFESRDGIAWERAKIDRFPACGESENNVLLDSSLNYWDNFMVFEDKNPACPSGERFKAIALYDHKWSEEFAQKHPEYAPLAKGGKALWCFLSEDGISFRPGWKLFGFLEHGLRFDSLNVAFWDPLRKVYRLYMRSSKPVAKNRFGERNARWVKFSESVDFKTWSKPEDIAFSDGIDAYQLYTNGIDQYPRNPELVVGFPTRYTERKQWSDNYGKLCDADRRRERMGVDARHGLAITDCVFMWSRDGRTFRREEDAFLVPGPEHPKNWNYGNCYPQRGFVVSPGRRGTDPELSFYVVVGCWSDSFVEMDRYALRMDGFVSYHGRYRTDVLKTKRVMFTGDELLVNFATSPSGRMFVTVRDDEGNSLRSDELFGDKVDRPVGFGGGSLADFAGKPVSLEFELSDADIYSFRFHKAAPACVRQIDSRELAARAAEYGRGLVEAGVSNLTDEVRVPLLGAWCMRYRATGSTEDLRAAQDLFAVQFDSSRPHATMKVDTPLYRDWLAVADSHFPLSKNTWPGRWALHRAKGNSPLRLAYRVKYLRDKAAQKRLEELNPSDDEVPRPGECRFADRLALRGIGAETADEAASRLAAIRPTTRAGQAKWLWAYWTAFHGKADCR